MARIDSSQVNQFLIWMAVLIVVRSGVAAEPHVTDSRYKLDLIAKEPEIVTPIGVAFDHKGHLLVIESHTHQRPKDYKGPAGDRIRMLSAFGDSSRLDHWSTFAEGFRHAMHMLVRDDGAVYLVTRHNVVLLRDTDNDGVADQQQEILRLDTKDDYPHNGLSGIALQPDGNLLVSMGENHGIFYQLIGSDGKQLTGKDGAGVVFQCTQDGRDLRRMAVGFWNPFGLVALPDGRIFVADNDPDSMPSCRLVHVVWGGDYGFRFEYGRAGTHPLQAWNGELPGTLPMMCGVGEAPTEMVAHAGHLWVTSWGDHRIDRYELVPRGASYGARREAIVQGGADFRPTGLAFAPDGSLYFADWVLRDYPVHGRGRLWRLTVPTDELKKTFLPRTKEDLAACDKSIDIVKKVTSSDPFAHAHGVWQIAQGKGFNPLKAKDDPRMKLAMIEALRVNDVKDKNVEALLRESLTSGSPEIRLFAVRWIADERMNALRDDVAKLLDGSQPNQQNYLAVLAAVDWLDHKPSLRSAEITDELLVRELQAPNRQPEVQALALSLLKPDNKYLTLEQLRAYIRQNYTPLRLEAVRSLAEQANEQRFGLLAEVARDAAEPDEVRAEAVMGLSAATGQNHDLLEKLARDEREVVRQEAVRALRLSGGRPAKAEAKPPADDVAAWSKLLAKPGDVAAGRRLFFSPAGARCSVCHKYAGRGGNVGPDLSQIGRSTSRDKIITSILQPSQEIAPDYQPWVLTTSEGKTFTGLRLPKPGDNGSEDYADAAGKLFTLQSTDIEDRYVASTSIMPDNLQSVLSIDDLRDLVTFLTAAKAVP